MKSSWKTLKDIAESVEDAIQSYDRLKLRYDRKSFECAKYKALFFGREALVKKLERQMMDNYNSIVCAGIHRDLQEMLRDGLLTADEYEFCK